MDQIMAELLNWGAVGIVAFVSFKTIIDEKKEDRSLYKDTIEKFSEKLDMFGDALQNNNQRLDIMSDKLESIEKEIKQDK